MDLYQTDKKQRKTTQFCSCKNSCQKGTGSKRAGCPCKDLKLYCTDKCECGTNVIVCKNIPHKNDRNKSVESDEPRSPQKDLATQLSNMKVYDETDAASISDGESSSSSSSNQGSFRNITSIEHTAFVIPGTPLTQAKRRLHRINNGYALVIHNKNFANLRPREGSEKDLDAIKKFCKEAGLTIDIQENLTVDKIHQLCRELNGKEIKKFKNHDAFLCFILSHGNRSGICGTIEKTIKVHEIVSYFKENVDLLGKPKLFFVQACRADKDDIEDDSCNDGQEQRLCPQDSADTLVAYSTVKGKPSYRQITTGSWFIQALMKQFNEHAQSLHLMDMMTLVNEDISGKKVDGYRQMPMQVSTLTKFVYFKMATTF